MITAAFSPDHPALAQFRTALDNLIALRVTHETGVRAPFQALLTTVAKERDLTLVAEQIVEGTKIRPDGTLRDTFNLPRGYWESKDTGDDLEAEIGKKKRKGYPFTNILFEDTQRAVLWQNGKRVHDADLSNAGQTAAILTAFLTWEEPDPTSFDNAMARFGEIIPDIAKGLITRIGEERDVNPVFARAFDSLFALCRETLNPQVSPGVVVEMLAQHLLTERLFRTIFDNADFVRRNIIAQKIEETVSVMMARSFSRGDFTKTLDKYYRPIEDKAKDSTGWEQKQTFLNNLYERFFQDFSKKAADTQGIVYTPQPIVNFMLNSVDALLHSEFGKTLSDEGVVILDPCVGTGNFMQNLVRRLSPMTLEHKYKQELFCNENMLLPYYIASLNIEHAYYEKMGRYEPFPGLCFTDTLTLEHAFAGGGTGAFSMFEAENAARVQAEQAAPVTVIIGNPPYNVGQMNENENNKNRVHSAVAKRLTATYVKDSRATNKNALWDMYVRFFRWATDRLGDRDGIIAFVSNNGFLRGAAFDGMRKHLADDFTAIYHLDFKGNAHTSGERRQQEGGNIFNDQIRTSVGITLLVRRRNREEKPPYAPATVFYHGVADYLKAPQKTALLKSWANVNSIPWQEMTPDKGNHWLNEGVDADYGGFLALKSGIFEIISNGLKTNRDDVVYDYDKRKLEARMGQFIIDYNTEVARWKASSFSDKERTAELVDSFVDYTRVKWSRDLKGDLRRGRIIEFDDNKIHEARYRPFTKKYVYLDRILNEEVYNQLLLFPTPKCDQENICLVMSDIAHRSQFSVLAVRGTPDLHSLASEDAFQCFPFYTYKVGDAIRRENITNDALGAFRARYNSDTPTKWDIFHYIYGLLHHPEYRTRYRENLKRELPRIPFAPDFATFTTIALPCKAMADLHTGYETADEYPLKSTFDPAATHAELFHVEKMRWTPDKTGIKVNHHLTLTGVPALAHDYTLGSRSALDWILDQYRIKGDSDPNRADDPEYIVTLVKRIITVSVETVKCIAELPPLGLGEEGTG